jgi:hypothetical protein
MRGDEATRWVYCSVAREVLRRANDLPSILSGLTMKLASARWP